MGVGATTFRMIGTALKGPGGDVVSGIQAGNWSGAIQAAGANMAAVTQPAALFPILLPAIVTGITGVALDALKVNPKIRFGRFTVKAV